MTPSAGRRLARHAVLLVAAVVFGYPFLWMVFGSLRPFADFFTNPWGPPGSPAWSNYAGAWEAGNVGLYFKNSVIVVACTVALVCLVSFPLAFALSRIGFRGNRVLLGILAVALFVPMQFMVIPLFDLELRLHILNTYLAMILPYSAGGIAFAAVFLSGYLSQIPRELQEAAMIDGAGYFTMMRRIFLPLSVPALATVVIFTFVNAWNELLIALTVTQTDNVRTLPVGLLNFTQSTGSTNYSLLFAALVIATVPAIMLFLACQRQFLGGLLSGAVKL